MPFAVIARCHWSNGVPAHTVRSGEMGTILAVVVVAGATAGVLALGAGMAVRARNASDTRTREALRRIGDGVEALSFGLGAVVDSARADAQELGRSVGITLDLDEALRRTAAAAAALPGMQAGAARVLKLDGSASQQAVGLISGRTGLEGAVEPPDLTPWDSAIITWQRQPGPGHVSALQAGIVAPVIHEGVRIGLLAAYCSEVSYPYEGSVDQLGALAAEAAPALAAAREHEAVRELVRTDPLTGLLNRRGLDEALNREIARASRTGSPLSVLMLDLDDFRAVNKVTYAHGDDVLREFARVLEDACRTTDVLCRRGGEEFLLILTDTPCYEALRLDSRIRALVSTTEFSHIGAVRYSSGITSLRPDDDITEIDKRASQLVNIVKAAGKNGVRHDCDADAYPPVAPPGPPTLGTLGE
jgi:diguanylate cyclase (GGDEF)-like protein